MTIKNISITFLVLFFGASVNAQLTLPCMVRDSMILQRDAKVNIWGWTTAHKEVTIKFNGKTYKTNADAKGKWILPLAPVKAGGPYTMQITSGNTIWLKDIYMGDVWFCSGQSNMVHQMNIHDVTYEKDIREANFPLIRQFLIPTLANLNEPQDDLPTGSWEPAIGEKVRPFSAVAFFFAKKLYEKYHIPIGIINASVGGTPIEAWTSEDGLNDFSAIRQIIEKNKDTGYVNSMNRRAQASGSRQQLPKDKGMTEKWYDPEYTLKGWRSINIPGYWEDQGLKDLNGIVWYRRDFDIPASMAGKPARIFLGRIVDADESYINGTLVGHTTYQYPQRRYKIPGDILKAGRNTFAIKVTNFFGKGGFVPDKPYYLYADHQILDLKGYWEYKVGGVFEPPSPGSAVFGINAQNQPAALYNAMVAPVINYTIKGFCWYQGESNAGKPKNYAALQQALILDWRNKWQQGTLPFLYVQLPGYMDYQYLPAESNWAEMREAQLQSLSVPNTAMAVTIDIGEWNDIHPDDKKDVGDRLALAAMKLAYAADIVYSGPLYQGFETEGNRIIISFSHTGSGLMTSDGEDPAEFAIAGADKKFVWASAKIIDDKIMVWHDDIKEPLYVRYAWADDPVNPNLYNKEGLPASPFRTDQ
ncbi:MAG: sialate O-acetylesterase [Terrimonas sp.]|nr:sialate O-acetylesterase [Terrimonas sp.]